MDLNFNKVSYDGDLVDLSEEEMQDVIREFEKAQESNVAEFEKAADTLDGVDEADIEDFAEARADLIEDITGADGFEEVPLTEEKLEDEDFGDLREWKEFVADTGESEESEQDFEDMGQKGETHGDDEGDDSPDFIESEIANISGVNVSE